MGRVSAGSISAFSDPLAQNYSGGWRDDSTFVITVLNELTHSRRVVFAAIAATSAADDVDFFLATARRAPTPSGAAAPSPHGGEDGDPHGPRPPSLRQHLLHGGAVARRQ